MASAGADHPAATSRTPTAKATATSHGYQQSVRRVSNRKSYPIEADRDPEFIDAPQTLDTQPFVSESDALGNGTLRISEITMLIDQWRWELCSMLLSIICICLMLTVLVVLDDKPLISWRFIVSPGVTLSVLAFIGTTSISLPVAACISQLKWRYFTRPRQLQDLQHFDNASRSPRGSIVFLIRFSTRDRANIALLGAMISALTLLYEPSTQQMLSYSIGYTNISDGSALAMRASGWHSEGIEAGSGLHAITKGLFGHKDREIFECSAPACYFPAHTSLAMCSECRDISNAVDRRCHWDRSGSASACPSGSNVTHYICYWTPHDTVFTPVHLTMGTFRGYGGWYPSLRRLGLSVQSAQEGDHFSSMAITVVNTTTDSTRVIGWTDRILPGDADVHVCSWSLCSRTSPDVAVVNGQSNHSAGSAPLILQGPFPAAGMTHLYSLYRRGLARPRYDPVARALALDPIANSNIEMTIDWLTMMTVWQELSDLITGDQALNFLQSNNLSAAVERISHELTKLILSNDNVWATEVQSQSVYAETYVYVRWSWLFLPMGLTLATLILLTLTIILCFKHGGLILKSSPLPFLFFGLRGRNEDEVDLSMVENLSDLEEIAKRTIVEFAIQGPQGNRSFVIVG